MSSWIQSKKIGDDQSNKEVVEALRDQQFPIVDIVGDNNDADIDKNNPLSLSETDNYTPDVFVKYLSAKTVAN